ncbi:hypothetical protein FACS189494_10450 [Spirochaetia bacterium]|nr:hypothetical protein FACS189494_10450 [Spirochaetia bacterium]
MNTETATIGTFEAKTHFSGLIENVKNGQDFVITHRGQPVAKIIPYNRQEKTRAEVFKQITDMRNLFKGTPPSSKNKIEFVRDLIDTRL